MSIRPIHAMGLDIPQMASTDWVSMQLAEWVASLANGALPSDVVERAKDCVLDLIGCALAGLDAEGTVATKRTAERTYRSGDAKIWFSNVGLSPVGAAFANAAAASILDIDDGHRLAMGHPGAAVIPAVLAAAAETGASGEEVIAAIVAGYEIAVRLGTAEHIKSYHTGNWTMFGVAAAVSMLHRLTCEQTAHAMSICAYHGPRLRNLTESSQMGAHVKESIPWSVVTGMTAVDLARNGFTGCLDALDLPDRFDRPVVLEGLGQDFRIRGVYFKRYSACRWTHTAADALLAIMQERLLEPRHIQSVEVETFGQAAALNNHVDPDTLEGAQYSLPFVLGVAAALGARKLSPMRSDILHNEAAVAFARNVGIVHSAEMDRHLPLRTPARVRVLAEGTSTEKLLVDAWGDAGSATSRADLRDKFRHLASTRISEARAAAIIAAVDGLDKRGPAQFLETLAEPAEAVDNKAA